MELPVHELERSTVRGAYVRQAAACRIPGEPHARPKIAPLRVHARFGWKPGIAREIEPGGSVREHGALDVLLKSLQIELVDGAVHQLLRKERLPANTVVQRHPRTQSPRILAIHAEVPLCHVQGIGGRLL